MIYYCHYFTIIVCEFADVETFWKYWSFIPRPSEILFDGTTRKEVEGRTIDAYSVFKKGIRPEWEDPNNKNGGLFKCRKTMKSEELDMYWENLVLGLIGETIDDGNEICGCRIVDKSKKGGGSGNRAIFRFEVWTRSGNEEHVTPLKLRINDILVDGDSKSKGRPLDFEFGKHSE